MHKCKTDIRFADKIIRGALFSVLLLSDPQYEQTGAPSWPVTFFLLPVLLSDQYHLVIIQSDVKCCENDRKDQADCLIRSAGRVTSEENSRRD